ncbi:MAG: DUF1592 domain-containing protein [Myxococcales bacterium]|nr:DUF1592 domain-containing protein [Myxococcales bacterium]
MRGSLHPFAWLPTLLGALGLAACDGRVSTGPAGPHDQWLCPGCPERPAPTTRFARLSHVQWENATTDLLRLPEPSGLSSTFKNDAVSGTFRNNGAELVVDSDLWQDYQNAAETLASRVTSSPEAIARLLPTDAPEDAAARARALVETLGMRAHRRPLTTEQRDRYLALFETGPDVYPDMEPFAAGTRVFLEALLQSPWFLYRVEASTEVRDGVIPLDGWEIASRLSFALWNTMPDESLFRAAADGSLGTAEGVRAQAERMLDDPRARAMVTQMHHELLEMDRWLDLRRSRTLFPAFDEQVPASLVVEGHRFVEHVVFDAEGTLTTLLTAPYTFADERLARIYGLEGDFGPEPRRVELDPDRRAGILTQLGFLAANASSTDTDPIHRGVYINRKVLCANLPPPPGTSALSEDDVSLPLRERIHNQTRLCGATCHVQLINPIGFAFEHYDAIGAWRDTDPAGRPINARDTYRFDSGERSFDGAVELAHLMVAEFDTHRCYVQHWLEYLHGRMPARIDGALVGRLAHASRAGAMSVRDLIVELVASDAFRTRSPDELVAAGGGS